MAGIEVKWKGDTATVRFGLPSIGQQASSLEASFREIAARHPRRLKIDTEHGQPGTAFSTVAKNVGFDVLEVLEVDSGQPLSRHRPDPIGVMDDVFRGCPLLQVLSISGSPSLTPTTHACLRRFRFAGPESSPASLAAIGECHFPELTSLVVEHGEHHSAEGDRVLGPAVAAMDAPRLREVRIDGAMDYPSLLAAFAPWVAAHPSLVECSLGGSIADKAWPKVIALVERHAATWARLEVFGLPVGEHLSARAFGELRARVPGLVDRGEDGGDDE